MVEFFTVPDYRLWFDEPQLDGRGDTVIGCSLDVAQVMGINPEGASTS